MQSAANKCINPPQAINRYKGRKEKTWFTTYKRRKMFPVIKKTGKVKADTHKLLEPRTMVIIYLPDETLGYRFRQRFSRGHTAPQAL